MKATYFHRRGRADNLDSLLALHQMQFPGNQLGICAGDNGTILIKVAYAPGTEKPSGALTVAEAKEEKARNNVL